MSDTNKSHEKPWAELGRIQLFVERGRHRSLAEMHAAEEALSIVVEEVEDHTTEGLRRRFRSLLSNRIAKYRRRAAIERAINRAAIAELNGQQVSDARDRNGDGVVRHTRLAAAVRRHASRARTGECEDPAVIYGRREEVCAVRLAIRAEDWSLMWDVAIGYTHEEVAVARGLPVGTVKARISRLRRWLRTRPPMGIAA